MASIYNPTSGATSCQSCGQPVQCGFDATKAGGVTCGDCLECRTPLKQEIVRLRTALHNLVEALGSDYLSTEGCEAFKAAEAVLEETK